MGETPGSAKAAANEKALRCRVIIVCNLATRLRNEANHMPSANLGWTSDEPASAPAHFAHATIFCIPLRFFLTRDTLPCPHGVSTFRKVSVSETEVTACWGSYGEGVSRVFAMAQGRVPEPQWIWFLRDPSPRCF